MINWLLDSPEVVGATVAVALAAAVIIRWRKARCRRRDNDAGDDGMTSAAPPGSAPVDDVDYIATAESHEPGRAAPEPLASAPPDDAGDDGMTSAAPPGSASVDGDDDMTSAEDFESTPTAYDDEKAGAPPDSDSDTLSAPQSESTPTAYDDEPAEAPPDSDSDTLSAPQSASAPPATGRVLGSAAPSRESVDFAAFAPQSIARDATVMLDIWAFLPDQYASVVDSALDIGQDLKAGRKAGVSVPRGEILDITIQIAGLEVPDPVDTLVWDGVPTNASFIVHVPSDAEHSTYAGTAAIGYQGLTIGKLTFLLSVAGHVADEYADHSEHSRYPKTAFASYASENRDEVLTRIQGMKKVAPDLDVFLDVLSLRSGDNWREKLESHVPTKDTFYLFWSQSAAQSEWVEREWRLALNRRGLNYIDPVPLEEPDTAPPPEELNELHFSDAFLAYIAYHRLKRQMSGPGAAGA